MQELDVNVFINETIFQAYQTIIIVKGAKVRKWLNEWKQRCMDSPILMSLHFRKKQRTEQRK